MNNRLEETELRRLRARMLLDRDGPGDRARARELLEKALVDYRTFEMPSYAAETERMLAIEPSVSGTAAFNDPESSKS
jgi:hypothetical protein